MAKNNKKTITFVATQYRSEPVSVNFYTKDGERVRFTATEKVPRKTLVRFKTAR